MSGEAHERVVGDDEAVESADVYEGKSIRDDGRRFLEIRAAFPGNG